MSDHRRRRPGDKHITLRSSTDQLSALRAELRCLLDETGIADSASHDVVLATHEAAVNAMVHGNQLDPEKRVTITAQISYDLIRIEVADEGPGFDWQAAVERARSRRIPADAVAGRGLMVMLHIMDALQYNTSGNVVTLEKRRGLT